jgi:hypothetical protein
MIWAKTAGESAEICRVRLPIPATWTLDPTFAVFLGAAAKRGQLLPQWVPAVRQDLKCDRADYSAGCGVAATWWLCAPRRSRPTKSPNLPR